MRMELMENLVGLDLQQQTNVICFFSLRNDIREEARENTGRAGIFSENS